MVTVLNVTSMLKTFLLKVTGSHVRCKSDNILERVLYWDLATVETTNNKSSAVTEMGDRGHSRQGPKRGGLLCPFRGSWDPD